MTKKQNINIPAILVHTIGENEYRVAGTVVGINEAAGTVSMKFNGYKNIEHDIPMEKIMVTEGILDTLKDVGKAALNAVKNLVRKVRGFLYVMINGRPAPDSINAPVNLAIRADRDEIPGVRFFPNTPMMELAGANGINLTAGEPFVDESESERKYIETYWRGVMKEYVADDNKSVVEAVKTVQKKYYADRVKNGTMRNLNEAFTLSLNNPSGFEDMYGQEASLAEIQDLLTDNILAQIDRGIGAPLSAIGPYIIWGAPGIGKTAALSLLAKNLKDIDGIDLAIETVQCSGLNADDWGLPSKRENVNTSRDEKGSFKFDSEFATSVPQAWLPVYRLTDNPEYNEAIDEYFNSGAAKPGNTTKKDGGIIFFDELTRLPKTAKNMMMALVDKGMYNDMVLASRWAIVCAANRFEDVLSSEDAEQSDFNWESAQSRRFNHITFVPDKSEWLDWARATNEKGQQNVHEMFCKFIELSDDKVWYATLDNGAYDAYLSDAEKTEIDNFRTNTDKLASKEARDGIRTLMQDKLGGASHLTVTPADWEKVSRQVDECLAKKIFRRHPELLKMCYDAKGTLNTAGLRDALDSLSPKEWDMFYNVWAKRLDKSGRMANNRLNFFTEYISKVVLQGKFGQDSAAMREWNVYNNYRQTFTPEVIESIWETGQLPAGPLRQDDNKYIEQTGDYKTATEYSKWKSQSELAVQVLNLVLENVPGGIQGFCNQIIADNAKIMSAAPLTDQEYDALFDKYLKMYTFKIGKTDIYPFIEPSHKSVTGIQKEILRAQFLTLENSDAARMMANVALYFSKVSFQMKTGGALIATEAYDAFKPVSGTFISQLKKTNAEVQNILMPTDKLASLSKQNKNEDQIAIASIIGYTAAKMLDRMKSYDRKLAAN